MSALEWAKRRLGRTGLRVTPLGLGGAHLGRTATGFSDEQAVRCVHRALELGINLIDTAPLYGESERRLGLALRQWWRRGGRREELVLSTKTGRAADGGKDYSADGTRRSVERSLRLLGTDYLDIVLVHDPEDLSPVLGRGGALEELMRLKGEGLVRAIGLGVRSHELHRRCIETGEFDVCLTFLDYNLVNQSAAAGVLEAAAARDVGVLNGAALVLGLLGGRDPREFPRRPETEAACALWDWARSRGADLLALNLQFCAHERRIASTLVGAASAEEIERDVRALREPIPAELWRELGERFHISTGLPA